MTDTRPRVYDTARAIRQRARTRALTRLARLHKAEFRLLLNEELQKAAAEVQTLEAEAVRLDAPRSATAAHAAAPEQARPYQQTKPTAAVPEPNRPAVILRAGARGGQTVEQRIRTDVAICPACINRHDADHRCPVCGNRPARVPHVRAPAEPAAPKKAWELALARDIQASIERQKHDLVILQAPHG